MAVYAIINKETSLVARGMLFEQCFIDYYILLSEHKYRNALYIEYII